MSASIPARGVYVEVTNPNSGHILTPDVRTIQRKPTANGLPRLELTTRKKSKWNDPVFEGAPLDVWIDGRPQPVDEVENIFEREGQVVLEGRGGIELRDRVRKNVNQDLIHSVAEDLIKNNTSYTANVDTPNVSDISDATLRDLSTNSEYTEIFADDITDTDPLTISGTDVEPLQTGFMQTQSDYTISAFTLTSGDTAYTDTGESDNAVHMSGERGSSQVSISTVTPDLQSVSVQVETQENAVVRLYDSGGTKLGTADGTSGAVDFANDWVDVDVNGNDVDQVQMADTDGTPSNETIKVNSDIDGIGNTTNTVGVDVSEGQNFEFSFENDHIIPQDDFRIDFRQYAYLTGGASVTDMTVEVEMDGTVLTQRSSPTNDDSTGFGYDTIIDGSIGDISSDLSTGTHTVKVFLRNNGDTGSNKDDGGVVVDVSVPYDNRFSYTFDNSPDSNDRLDGPEDYPDAVDLVSIDVKSTRIIDVGIFESTFDDTSNNQALALSADGGQSFSSTSKTSNTSVDFSGTPASYRVKVTFSRYGSRTTDSPATGFNPQTMTDVRFAADQLGDPHISERLLDGKGVDVLNNLAEEGDFIWEFRVDENGNKSVEWTKPGQRTTGREDAISEFETQRTIEERVDKVVVKGSSKEEQGENVTADHGNAVTLEQDGLVPGKEVVTDGSGTEYNGAGDDYEMDYKDGTITTQTGSDISDGQSLTIDYEYKPTGSKEVRTPVDVTRKFDIGEIASQRAAENAADEIADQIGDPLIEGRLVIPASQVGWNVVDAINFSALPVDDNLEIRDIEHAPGSTVMLLGSRKPIRQVVDNVSQRFETLSGRV